MKAYSDMKKKYLEYVNKVPILKKSRTNDMYAQSSNKTNSKPLNRHKSPERREIHTSIEDGISPKVKNLQIRQKPDFGSSPYNKDRYGSNICSNYSKSLKRELLEIILYPKSISFKMSCLTMF